MIRRFGKPPVTGQRYTHRPGAYVIAHEQRGVLMTYQNAPYPEVQLPGGGIDPGESPLHAAHREVMEETGWRIANLRRIGCFRRFVYMPEYGIMAEKLCHIYSAKPVYQVQNPTEADHLAIWMPPDAAIEMVANPGDAQFLRAVFR